MTELLLILFLVACFFTLCGFLYRICAGIGMILFNLFHSRDNHRPR